MGLFSGKSRDDQKRANRPDEVDQQIADYLAALRRFDPDPQVTFRMLQTMTEDEKAEMKRLLEAYKTS